MNRAVSSSSRRSALTTLGAVGASSALVSLTVRDAFGQSGIPIILTTGLKLANYGPLYVAARNGLFEKQGLAVTLNVGGTVVEPVAIALSGRGQFAATGTGMAVNSTLEGGQMKIIAKMCGALGMWVITRPGTAFTSLNDFKGKKVASLRFPSNTVTSPTFAMKKFAGFDPKTAGVEFIEGPPGSIIGAVRDRRADIGVVFEWDASIAAQQGLQVAYGFADQMGPILLTSVMVKNDYITSNPDLVQRFCNALAASMKLIRENSAAYVSTMGAEFNNLERPVVEAGCARLLATKGFVPINPIVSKAEWEASSEHDFLAGTIRKQLSFEEMVDNRFAQKATDTFGAKT
jgi:NitT/TauT family transport system substrate-binding protein